MRKPILSVESLQNELWSVLQAVKEKKISPAEANAVTLAAKEICVITRLELQYKAMIAKDMQLKAGDVPLLERR